MVQWLKANGQTRLLKRNDWPRYVETEPETYRAEEVEQFLAACDPFERVLFEFFWMTGFRDAEVQHVTRADLDLKEHVVRVTEKPQWGFIPKNWEQREVPIPDRPVESLESLLARKDLKGPLRCFRFYLRLFVDAATFLDMWFDYPAKTRGQATATIVRVACASWECLRWILSVPPHRTRQNYRAGRIESVLLKQVSSPILFTWSVSDVTLLC